MKTAMNEWIEWLNAYSFELPLELEIKANELLEKEKKQIIEAVTYGNRQEYYDGTEELGNKYYNETFKD
jgi:hypothetical protein